MKDRLKELLGKALVRIEELSPEGTEDPLVVEIRSALGLRPAVRFLIATDLDEETEAHKYDVQTYVRRFLADAFGQPESGMEDDTVITRDLGADELSLLEAVIQLESDYGIDLGEDFPEHGTSVGELITRIKDELKGKTQ